jgi:hypothetical protein
MRNVILCAAALLVSAGSLMAQLTISNGAHNMEISGGISWYYNHRIMKEGETNLRKNSHRLRDAQVQIEGRYRDLIEYELQIDFADLAATATGPIDGENPGLMDSYITFKHLRFVDIRVGYGKTPYSRSSQVPFIYTPYWQRVEMVRGDIFPRRDVGVTLISSFWKQRITIQAGAYNGIGEISLRGDNDPSGSPEFVGRVDFAYPSRYRYRDIDDRVSPVPMFNLGVNARYTDRQIPQGSTLLPASVGEYNIRVVDGTKTGYGFDVSAQYMGFSAQFEMHQFVIEPQNPNSFLFQGLPAEFHEGFVRAGGYYGQLNYFSRELKSIFSARYEALNINDLAEGELQRLSVAYAYQLRGFDSMIKVQYFRVLAEEIFIDPLRWTEQIRIGVQYNFK